MGECKRIEGILAASMYEPLLAVDRQRLDDHLDACPRCRETVRDLATLRRAIPATTPDLGGDLLASIRRELAAEAPCRVSMFRRHVSTVAAAAAVLVVATGSVYVASNSSDVTVPEPVTAQRASQLDRTFAQVDRLMDAHFHSRAFVMLNDAVTRFPEDPRAAEAAQHAAALAFDELQWYPEAHATFRTLRDRFTPQFDSVPSNRIHLEMLEESVGPNGDYVALRSLDAARASGEFDAYEKVMSQYPGTYVASRALDEMAAALGGDQDRVAALETLAESCGSPVAVAQVKLALARTLDERGASRDRVRGLYVDAASSESVALASAAREALRALDGETAR